MEKLNVALSSLKSEKEGVVSRPKVEAVAEAALRALRHGQTAGEIAETLVIHITSSSKEQRLASIYALHEAVYREKKKLEEKNGNHRTEKRGSLSMAMETKLPQVMSLFRDASIKEKDQIAKILQKWSERFVFPAEVCQKSARAAECAIPSEPTAISPRKESAKDSVIPVEASAGASSSGPGSTSLPSSSAAPVQMQIKPSIVTTGTRAPLPPPILPPLTTSAPSTAPAPGLVTTVTTGKGGGWSTFARSSATATAPSAPPPSSTSKDEPHSSSRDDHGRRGYSSRDGDGGRARSPRREKRSRWDH